MSRHIGTSLLLKRNKTAAGFVSRGSLIALQTKLLQLPQAVWSVLVSLSRAPSLLGFTDLPVNPSTHLLTPT